MQIEYKFRHQSPSQELTHYVDDRIARLEKYEMKPFKIEVTFWTEGVASCVGIHVRAEGIEMHSQCEAESYLAAVDIALEKMSRQLARKKAKVQKHKSASHRRGLKVG